MVGGVGSQKTMQRCKSSFVNPATFRPGAIYTRKLWSKKRKSGQPAKRDRHTRGPALLAVGEFCDGQCRSLLGHAAASATHSESQSRAGELP